MPKLTIDIQYASPALEKAVATIASTVLVKKWVRSAIGCNGLITLRFVNLNEGKLLNSHFRDKDKATNVLTFPYEHTKSNVVADIIFCIPIIKQEAKEQNKGLKAHLAHLIIHGCLHAQGLDHEHEKEAQKMEAREVAILKSLGFSNPYVSI